VRRIPQDGYQAGPQRRNPLGELGLVGRRIALDGIETCIETLGQFQEIRLMYQRPSALFGSSTFTSIAVVWVNRSSQ
jgi:hypothetical protein